MQLIAILLQKSPVGIQFSAVFVISLLYHNPPVTPPAHTFLCSASLGSNINARVRPPILAPVPLHSIGVELLFSDCSASSVLVCSYATISLSTGTLPVAGSAVIIYS